MVLHPQHHILIGLPGSGKSTFAQALQHHVPQSAIISTDEIRTQLYGDPTLQGHWPDIFAQVQHHCQQTIAAGKTVIYDATNAKRAWRLNFLRSQLQTHPDQTWIGWYLTTSLDTCLNWNRQRDRQVPETVIQDLYQSLHTFPPEPAEGMAKVQQCDPSQVPDLEKFILSLLIKLPRQIINRRNATEHTQHNFHAYSDLLEFERLLYLLQLLLEYPGAGQLRQSQPDRLQELLAEEADLNSLTTDLDELSAMLSQRDPLYSDRSAVVRNLDWLHLNGFLSSEPCTTWDVPECNAPGTPTHSYSDRDRFLRVMGIVRFMLHHPFYEMEGSCLETLTHALCNHGILQGSWESCRNTLRKDIQLILKPYGLLQSYRHNQGYFLGTGIFSHSQLLRLHQFLAGQAKSLADPTVLVLFKTLSDRLKASKLSDLKPYPVRALYNFTITDQKHLPKDALANTIDRLEQEIEQGQCLELQRYLGVGRHGTESEPFFEAWPVQIVFHNIGWYLGYEVASGEKKGLLAFERLDRLFRGYIGGFQRDRKAQERSAQQLEKLFQASGGLFLGKDPKQQQQWLKGNATQRKAISTTLELWCNDYSFSFISEGDQRFPPHQIQLSPRLPESTHLSNPKLFRLKPTGDPHYPHRFRVQLPPWALQGIDLQRWIWGFKMNVRIISPLDLAAQFRQEARAIEALYRDPIAD